MTTAWLGTWSYRKKHLISGADNAGRNYQVLLTIHSGAGADSGGTLYLNSHAADFPNDLRFTDSNGRHLLTYWIADPDADPIHVWLRVEDSLNEDQYVYVYYGRSGADSLSNGLDTFIEWDDFNDDTLFGDPDGYTVTEANNGDVLVVPFAQLATKYGSNPIWENSDFAWVNDRPDNFCVLRSPIDGSPVMYNSKYWAAYEAGTGNDRGIGICYSTNLIDWTDQGGNPVLKVTDGAAEAWEKLKISPNDFLYIPGESSPYWLFYRGTDAGVVKTCIGYATSSDMATFTRIVADNPIVDWVPAWEANTRGVEDFRIQKMSDGSWMAFYEADQNPTGGEAVGVAKTTDRTPNTGWADEGQAMSWMTAANFIANPALIRINYEGSTYYWGLYEWDSANTHTHSCFVAESDIFTIDKWRKLGRVIESEAGWEDDSAITNCIIKVGDTAYIYYSGDTGANIKIGLATIALPDLDQRMILLEKPAATDDANIEKDNLNQGSIAVGVRYKLSATTHEVFTVVTRDASDNRGVYLRSSANGWDGYYDGAWHDDTNFSWDLHAWNYLDIPIDIEYDVYNILVNDGIEASNIKAREDVDDTEKLQLMNGTDAAGICEVWLDNVYVRKYVNPEPSHSTWDTEERYNVSMNQASTLIQTLGGCDVTWKQLMLAEPDGTTGWYKKSYVETTGQMVIIPQANRQMAFQAGTHVRTDALGVTADAVREGDHIENGVDGRLYEVVAYRELFLGDSFSHCEVDLHELGLEGL